MTKKKKIAIIAIVVIGIVSLTLNAIWLINVEWDRIRNNVIVTAQAQVLNTILASVEQNGEVTINIPDGNGGNKSLVLVTKGE